MSEIDDLRAELAERDRRLAESIETLRREQKPLTKAQAAQTLRQGYEQSAAEREAAQGGEAA